MLYKSCRELPIHNFFEINRTNDLSYLVRSGKIPSSEILQGKFLEIVDEYNSLFSAKNEDLSEKSKLYTLTLKLMNLEIIESIIKSSGITDEIKNIAKKLRVKPENIAAYISGIRNDLNRLKKEIENHENEQNTQKVNNGDSLEKTLTLIKENGFNFDRFTTPIIEFVYAINRLEEKSKQMENAK